MTILFWTFCCSAKVELLMSVIKDANEIKFEDRPQHGNYCPKLFEKSWSPNRACTDAMKLLSSLIINDVMKIFAVDTQFKQLRKRSLKKKKKKKFRLQRDSNPWPLRYRCSALPTELWSHNCWEQVNFSGSIMPLRVIQHYTLIIVVKFIFFKLRNPKDWHCFKTAVSPMNLMRKWLVTSH